MKRLIQYLLFSAVAVAFAFAQDVNSSQSSTQDVNNTSQATPVNSAQQPSERPTFRVNVVSRTTEAINYRYRSGATQVNFKGTDLTPKTDGHARVQSSAGKLDVQATLDHLQPASSFGPEYLTYVLWAITPEGRPANLGELVERDGHADLHATTDLQAFGLIVTAEPYFAVTQPGNLVVAENVVRPDTEGWQQHIDAKFDLLERGSYMPNLSPADLPATTADRKKVPLSLLEARNAVAIAKASGADQYAGDTLAKAQQNLDRAEDYLRRKQGETPIGTMARSAAQFAEDARVLTIRRKQEEQVAAERRAIEEREAASRQQAEQAHVEVQQQSQAAEQARIQAEDEARRRQLAESERQAAEQAKADAERARQEAEAAAQQADQARQQAEQDREQMRSRLVQQLNQVLQTRDTAQGIIVTMPDVLFDFNKSTLKPAARERLAKVAGIILAYPEIKLNIEGYTDNIGTEEYNQVLSEKRAASVRDYLIAQGVNLNSIMAQGFGKSNPVASNATAQGRQLNRRVELVVTGESIGRNVAPGATGEPGSEPAAGSTLPQSGQTPPPAATPPARTIPPR